MAWKHNCFNSMIILGMWKKSCFHWADFGLLPITYSEWVLKTVRTILWFLCLSLVLFKHFRGKMSRRGLLGAVGDKWVKEHMKYIRY